MVRVARLRERLALMSRTTIQLCYCGLPKRLFVLVRICLANYRVEFSPN